MQFAESWLRRFVNPEISSEALAHLLTMAGLEVEDRRTVADAFTNVCVGYVRSIEQHPNADRLKVCQVDLGEHGTKQIVCGATNVAEGVKVPCALPGAILPGGVQIRPTMMRGVESAGMLCSAKELGINQESSGLLLLPNNAQVGQDIRHALNLDDIILTLKMTPNRADCLSILGVAREVVALTGTKLQPVSHQDVIVQLNETVPVDIWASDLCGRFSGRIIRGVNAKAQTPHWMKTCLERAGLRSISALVDISNYVMLESGQPSHIFDLNQIKGGLGVRWAKKGERLKLLSGEVIDLDTDIGVIADETGVLAMAGIMGGDSTAVTLDTTDIFIETAFWWPDAIVGRARRYHFSTEASHRFERGVDYAVTAEQLNRISALILEICGGQAGPVSDIQKQLPQRTLVTVRLNRAEKLIGMPLDIEELQDCFKRLGCDVTLNTNSLEPSFLLVPPSYRFDLQIEEDFIEEMIRVIGYDRLPDRPPLAFVQMRSIPEQQRSVHALRHQVAALGYQEVVNFSFVPKDWEEDFSGNQEAIELLNPIASHLNVMRSSLIGSLVANLRHNISHRVDRVRIFEVARVFAKDTSENSGLTTVSGVSQKRYIAGLCYGLADQLQWSGAKQEIDFFDVKGDVEQILPFAAEFISVNHPALHPGRSAAIIKNQKQIGCVGQLHPLWVQKYELPHAPFVFELELDTILSLTLSSYKDISKQPIVVRDLALVVGESVSAQQVMDALHAGFGSNKSWLQHIVLFDQFKPKQEGKGLGLDEKSLTFRITLQDFENSIEDAQVELLLNQLVQSAAQRCGAKLR
jgi:phenylalanyl-tRNA synthetase beta chain